MQKTQLMCPNGCGCPIIMNAHVNRERVRLCPNCHIHWLAHPILDEINTHTNTHTQLWTLHEISWLDQLRSRYIDELSKV